jgi:hypothetical protein
MALLIYATGGDTFPERVVDHLFFYALLLWMGLWISLMLKWNIPEKIEQLTPKIKNMILGVAMVILFFLLFFRGLDIDRTDKRSSSQYLDLIRTDSNPANAWLTLLKGDPQTYHREMITEFEKLKSCQTDTCVMKRPSVLPSQLYDSLSDRRNRNGDRYMGYYFNRGIKVVKFEE